MARFLFILLSIIWGSSFILMKKAAPAFGPTSIGAYRVLAGGLTLALVWMVLRRRGTGRRWPIRWSHVGPLLLVAGLGYAIPYWVQPYLIPQYGSAFVGMMVSLVPLLTIAVSVPMLGIYPSARQVIGVMGGLVFMGAIFGDGLSRDVPLVHLLLAGSIPLAYALANTYIKRRFTDVPPMALSMTALLLAGGLMLPLSATTESVAVNDQFATALVALMVLGVLATGVAKYMFYRLIQSHGPLFAGMVAYVIPAVALMWGWLDGETLTLIQVAALAGIFAMVALVQSSAGKARREGRAEPAAEPAPSGESASALPTRGTAAYDP